MVPVRADRPPPALSRVVVLIHGYNNTFASAGESYAGFTAHLEGLDALTFWPLAHFFWPGDKPWGALSRASYPVEIGAARRAARELRLFLATLRGPVGAPVEIAFVAHSLGARLLLELLEDARAHAAVPRVPIAALMAAAVPVARVEPDGVLREAASLPGRAVVFHSEHDAVLRWAFRLGQLAAGEGFASRAVGRFGEPRRGLWAVSVPTPHGHGEYWESRACAEEVARQLGAAPPRSIGARPILARALPSRAHDRGPRAIGDA